MTSIFEGQPPQTRPFPSKTRGLIWVPGIYKWETKMCGGFEINKILGAENQFEAAGSRHNPDTQNIHQWKLFFSWIRLQIKWKMTPWKINMEPKNHPIKRKIIFETFVFGFKIPTGGLFLDSRIEFYCSINSRRWFDRTTSLHDGFPPKFVRTRFPFHVRYSLMGSI